MLLRARTIKARGWVPRLLLGGRDRSPNASTPIITITKILAADRKNYDTVAAVEGTVVDVCPEQQIVAFSKSQAEGRPEPTRRRRQDT